MKKGPTIYGRLITTILAALIGTYALAGAIGFAILGFLFPMPMEKVLFVLTLFQ